MSYTLRGRLESRLATALVAVAAACVAAAVLRDWWPLELAAAMIGVGLALDAVAYHPLLPYQPGWAALPLGALELGLVMALVRALRIDAPLDGALVLFAGVWLAAQVLGHAVLPLLRLSYAEDGGELGRGGPRAAVAVASLLAAAGSVAWATQPPTVHLRAGVHQGPLVITYSQRLVGDPGAIVRGGIVVRASDVTIRDVTVVGGENGIEVDGVDHVVLRNVRVSGAALDGIHVRRAAVTIDGCEIDSLGNPYAQGIDISYAFDKHMSMVSDCTVVGGQEGIVTHFAMADLMRNRVSRTTLRGISMTEMSMGAVERNEVRDALGVAIYCNDHSMCEIRHNVVAGTRVDPNGDLARQGFGILAFYSSEAEVSDNHLVDSPGGTAALADSRLLR